MGTEIFPITSHSCIDYLFQEIPGPSSIAFLFYRFYKKKLSAEKIKSWFL